MNFEDKTLTCRECGNEFAFTAGEQAFFAEKGLQNVPSRCPNCRAARKAGGGGGSGHSSHRGERGGSNSGGPRIQHPVQCAGCGKDTTVPFVPKHDRPVYCSDCFEQQRGGASVAAKAR